LIEKHIFNFGDLQKTKSNLMKHLLLTIFIFFSSVVSLCSQETGYVNFTLETSEIQPQKKYRKQSVTLLGCNTVVINNDKKYWEKAPEGLHWKKKNQVLKNVPYGYQFDKKYKRVTMFQNITSLLRLFLLEIKKGSRLKKPSMILGL